MIEIIETVMPGKRPAIDISRMPGMGELRTINNVLHVCFHSEVVYSLQIEIIIKWWPMRHKFKQGVWK